MAAGFFDGLSQSNEISVMRNNEDKQHDKDLRRRSRLNFQGALPLHQEQHGRASCWSSRMYSGCSGLPGGENTDDEQQSSSGAAKSGTDDKKKESRQSAVHECGMS